MPRTRHRHAIAAASLLALAPLAHAQVQWREGDLVYTPAIDFVTGPTAFGTGYWTRQAHIVSPPQPTVGQAFYVSLRMEGIASPAAGRLMMVSFIPPEGTTVLVDPATPVRCFYRAMDGGGSFVEFTSQVITDTSFGASLRVTGCPQPTGGGGTPYGIVPIPNGAAYQLDRRDPQAPGQTLWPLGSQAGYEFFIPLVATRTFSGNAAITTDRFYGAIQSVQGDYNNLWALPHIGLLVHPASAAPVADLEVSRQMPPPPPPSGRVGYTIRCANNGPSTATDVRCGFRNVPAGLNATTVCSPASPAASLAPGAAMVCSVILDRYIGFAEMEGVASSSATQDSNLANNIHAFSLFGGLVELIQRDGFESP